eukprot:810396-Rhodomonas_salina.2
MRGSSVSVWRGDWVSVSVCVESARVKGWDCAESEDALVGGTLECEACSDRVREGRDVTL